MRALWPMLLSSLAAGPAAAGDVWIDCNHGGFLCGERLDAFTSALEDSGATVHRANDLDFDEVGATPQLVVIVRPTLAFDLSGGGDAARVQGVLAQGGRLVLLGDVEEDVGSAASNALLRELLAAVPGHGLTLGTLSVAGGCAADPGVDIESHALTAGLSRWHRAFVNEVGGGTPLLRYDDAGTPRTLAAVASAGGGSVVLFGDLEGFSFNCQAEGLAPDWSADQAPLWLALATVGIGPEDGDGDGFAVDVDCDDADPTVHPDAQERCEGGVDDDCDGAVDGDDPDCVDDDDDAGDDDAGDDDAGDDDAGDDDAGDDDSLQLPGDDDTSDDDDGGCCRASAARGRLGVEAGALTLVALRRRRRR